MLRCRRWRAAWALTAPDIQWVVNGFMLPLSALVLIGGALADRVGRKLTFRQPSSAPG